MNYKDPQNMGCVRPQVIWGILWILKISQDPMGPLMNLNQQLCHPPRLEALGPGILDRPWRQFLTTTGSSGLPQAIHMQKNTARNGQTEDSIIVLLSMEHV